MNAFSKEELERYSRHLILPEFNIEGQRNLKNSKVLVVGAGGLGSPVLLYLTAAGIGTIGIVDFDLVDDSNLQRQVLFTTDDIGKSKAEAAEKRLKKLNPFITFHVYKEQLNASNALEIIGNYDIVVDGTDNFPTRYLVNDACVLLDKVNIYGSIFRFEGQVSVFNLENPDGSRGPNYRDLFPEPPPPGMVPSCSEGGVLGVLPGIIGTLQANEVIKVASGVGDPLSGRLFLYDAFTFETRTVKIPKPQHPSEIAGLIDYEDFCGMKEVEVAEETVKNISVLELSEMDENTYQLIDVREPYEIEIASIGGELIPLSEIEASVERIATTKKVVLYCRSGVRSKKAIRLLEKKFNLKNLYNLDGGIHRWAKEVDSNMPTY
jgi:molybdopterin/thiamine biosynthesis adenylyltransferase/rhodanese-related sulfurtransferase